MFSVSTSRKGVASIIGGAFIILIIVSGYAFYVLSTRATSDLQNTYKIMSEKDVEKNNEQLKFKSTTVTLNGDLEITLVNNGIDLIVINYTGIIDLSVPNSNYHFDVLLTQTPEMREYAFLDPGEEQVYTIPNTLFNLNRHYKILLITDKGNIFPTYYP